jgi:hypothetical protein
MYWGISLAVACFVTGFLAHVLKVSSDDVQKTLFPNKLAWFKVFWPNVVVRLSICVALWCLYATDPTLFVKLLNHFSLNFNFSVPATKVVSFIVGFFADSLLDLGTSKIPFLGRQIPSAYIPAEVKAQAAQQAADKSKP